MPNNNIQIAMLELSDQNRAVLNFYFSDKGKNLFTVVDKSKADALITDYDIPGAKAYVSKLLSADSYKIIIILSIKKQELPSVIWLAKPITIDALKQAAEKIQQILSSSKELKARVAKQTFQQTSNKETSSDAATQNPVLIPKSVLREELTLGDGNNTFGIPKIDKSSLASNKEIISKLVVTEALIAEKPSTTSVDSNVDAQKITTARTEVNETPQFDFDSIQFGTSNDIDVNSEEYIDTLLESLIGDGEDVTPKQLTATKKSGNSSSHQNVSLNDELQAVKSSETKLKETVAKEAIPRKATPKGATPRKAIPRKAIPRKAIPRKVTPKNTKAVEDIDSTINLGPAIKSIHAEEETYATTPNADYPEIVSDFYKLFPQEVPDKAEERSEDSQNIMETMSLVEENSSSDDGFYSKEYNTSETDVNLQSLLNEVRSEAKSSNTHYNKAGSFVQTDAERRWLQLCGNNKSISAQAEISKFSFTLQKHLLSTLTAQIKAVRGDKQLYRLKYRDLVIVFDLSKNSIYCSLAITSDEYSKICFTEIEHKHIKIHDLDYSEVKLYRKDMEKTPDKVHTIESFIWSTSLLTARGRLPDDTDITKEVGLKFWPNLTRLERIPHAMQIAALFAKHPWSLIKISQWLSIEQRYVFSFYNAVLALGLLELNSSNFKKTNSNIGKKSKDAPGEKNFLGRLLKRL